MNGWKPCPDKTALALLDPDGSFLERLQQDREALKALLERLPEEGGDRKTALTKLEKLAHRLAGAAGTFGHDAIGEAAMALEDCVAEAAVVPTAPLIDMAIEKAGRLHGLLNKAVEET